jgi:ubiquinol oxidase
MTEEHSDQMFNNLEHVTPQVVLRDENYRHAPRGFRDRIAKMVVHFSASCADFLFQERYGHRAVVLETIAAVPGMVGGLFQHLKSLRFMRDDNGWIQTLLDEAENERLHLIIYSEVAKPSVTERFLIVIVQFLFYNLYFILYLFSPKTAHRVVGFFEEEAIHSYQHYLALVEQGVHENIPATKLAISYWKLHEEARLTDMIKATIVDEMAHRDVNHRFSDDERGTRMWH